MILFLNKIYKKTINILQNNKRKIFNKILAIIPYIQLISLILIFGKSLSNGLKVNNFLGIFANLLNIFMMFWMGVNHFNIKNYDENIICAFLVESMYYFFWFFCLKANFLSAMDSSIAFITSGYVLFLSYFTKIFDMFLNDVKVRKIDFTYSFISTILLIFSVVFQRFGINMMGVIIMILFGFEIMIKLFCMDNFKEVKKKMVFMILLGISLGVIVYGISEQYLDNFSFFEFWNQIKGISTVVK